MVPCQTSLGEKPCWSPKGSGSEYFKIHSNYKRGGKGNGSRYSKWTTVRGRTWGRNGSGSEYSNDARSTVEDSSRKKRDGAVKGTLSDKYPLLF